MKVQALVLILATAFLFGPQSFAQGHSGVEMRFDFLQLEPGHLYEVTLKTAWFSRFASPAPEGGIQFNDHDHTLSFHAPAKPEKGSHYAQAHFVAGAYFPIIKGEKTPIEITVDAPQPAVVTVSIPDLKYLHTYVHDARKTDMKLLSSLIPTHPEGKGGLDGCLIGMECTFERPCDPPEWEGEPLKCYGPIMAKYLCCWIDPL